MCDELVDLRDAVDQSMSPSLEGIAMSMVAAYNELQCVYMPELCQKFVTQFVIIIRISFASCCNEMSAQIN
jgi:hypothetical protein